MSNRTTVRKAVSVIITLILLAVATAWLLVTSGCAGPGALKRIPLTDENGQPATLVAHNQIFPDWMVDGDQLAINYLVSGSVGSKQLAAIAEAERGCRVYTHTVRPNELVAVLSHGTLYAIAGAIGVGLGAEVFAGAQWREYAQYGAFVSGFAGAANGIVTTSGKTYTFENCAERVITKLFPNAGVTVIQKSPY